jgi:acyl-CoA synthetase (AMP-forming)/AMP-acid ligase II
LASDLDTRFDEMLARVTGPGGRLVIERDAEGRAIVGNFPATVPGLLRIFCELYGAEREAVVAGDERLTFADLDRISEAAARALAGRGIGKGDRVGIAMRNCPSWIVAYMGIVKAGAVATLLNGWWQSHELEHALALAEPKLVIADAPRAKRIEGVCGGCEILTLEVEKPVEKALAPLLDGASADSLPELDPEDDATILFTSGSTGEAKGALSTHRAVTTATYCYAAGLMTLLGLLIEEDREPATPPRTLLSVPLFHVTGEVPVMLNSFVVGRCMVVMPKWDAGEALRLIEQEKIT